MTRGELIRTVCGIITAAAVLVGLTMFVNRSFTDIDGRIDVLEFQLNDTDVSYERMPVGSIMFRPVGSDRGCPGDWVSMDLQAGGGSIIRPCVKQQ